MFGIRYEVMRKNNEETLRYQISLDNSPFYLYRYTPECSKLLAQYKTTLKLLGNAVPSLDAFVSDFRVGQCISKFPEYRIYSLTGVFYALVVS